MKNFALMVAVTLIFAVPASASEISEAAFLTSLAQIEAPVSPIDLGITPVPNPPSCDNVNSLACSTAGATTVCLDGCGYRVSCVCTTYVGPYKYWNCGWQC